MNTQTTPGSATAASSSAAGAAQASPSAAPSAAGLSPRQERLRLLALADSAQLEAFLDHLHDTGRLPSWTLVRGPESGLVMVRGRIGGQGQAFNVGEALVTRCCISLATGTAGPDALTDAAAADALLTATTPKDAAEADTPWTDAAQDTGCAGLLGCGYVLGEQPRHAEMMAVLDALWQDEHTAPLLDAELLPTLCTALRERYAHDAAAGAATRVDFFTMTRGEDKD